MLHEYLLAQLNFQMRVCLKNELLANKLSDFQGSVWPNHFIPKIIALVCITIIIDQSQENN